MVKSQDESSDLGPVFLRPAPPPTQAELPIPRLGLLPTRQLTPHGSDLFIFSTRTNAPCWRGLVCHRSCSHVNKHLSCDCTGSHMGRRELERNPDPRNLRFHLQG